MTAHLNTDGNSRTAPGDGGTAAPETDSRADLGGDPPCWLDQVCPECGRMIENRLADTCPVCGAARA